MKLIAKEQIVDLKKKLAEAEGAKNVVEWARDEALKAKTEAEFAKTEAKSSNEKAEEEAYDSGGLRPRPFSRLKSLEYAGSTAPRSRMKPSNKLGLRLHLICGR